jgi:sugar O-acyltransferase (sialic acid O-acetyltransferase NeuD family)
MILYGASGHGKVVAEILRDNGINGIVFCDDNPDARLIGETVTSIDAHIESNDVIVTVGLNHIRKNIVLRNLSLKYSRAIHSRAVVSPSANILEGTVVMAGAIINTDSTIGKHVIINSGAVVEHDCEISDFVHVSPNATLCGGVKVGEGTWIGAGSTIKNGVKIGNWSVIGAGAVVVSDIPDNKIYVGNPARCASENIKYK